MSKAGEVELRKAVAALAELTKGKDTWSDLSANWELVYTTEKETLFIVQNASWFGTEAGPIYQGIDTEASTLKCVPDLPAAPAPHHIARTRAPSPAPPATDPRDPARDPRATPFRPARTAVPHWPRPLALPTAVHPLAVPPAAISSRSRRRDRSRWTPASARRARSG